MSSLYEFRDNLYKRNYPKDIVEQYLNKVQWEHRPKYLEILTTPPFTNKVITLDYNPLWALFEEKTHDLLKNTSLEEYSLILRQGQSIQQVGNKILKKCVSNIVPSETN